MDGIYHSLLIRFFTIYFFEKVECPHFFPLVPVLRAWDELIKDPKLKAKTKEALENLQKSTRESMNGQVAEDLTFEDWLKRKPEDFQKEVLGPGRHELWKKGKISLRDLIDQTGRPLTVGELKAFVKREP